MLNDDELGDIIEKEKKQSVDNKRKRSLSTNDEQKQPPKKSVKFPGVKKNL